MTKYYILSILIMAIGAQNIPGQYIEKEFPETKESQPALLSETISFPVVYGKKNDGLPDRMKIRGVIEEVTFVPFGCGFVLWYGTAKIKLLNKVKGYAHEYVYIVAPCLTATTDNFLNKFVELKVSKLLRQRKFDEYKLVKTPFDSKGIAFYKWDEHQD